MAENKKIWKPGTLLNPVPVVMLSCGDINGKKNIITVAWAGTICSDPPMVSVSIRKSRFSHQIIKESGKFVINLVSEDLVKETDWCGVKSGSDTDKFAQMNLTAEKAETSDLPIIKECPVNIECTVTQILELGSHDMFLAKVDSVSVREDLIDSSGAMDLKKAKLVAYSHGEYFSLGEKLGSFGYSVRKKK
ncbi:MAG: flavin reductase family protein [Bacteroidales bacterium]|nr:flavin reductase family protein [Bacteroidales bacterium]